MRLSPTELVGFEINDRLRLVELTEERPFAYFYRAEVLALSRVVGSCAVTVYVPTGSDPDDLVDEIRSLGRVGSNKHLYSYTEVGTLRHPALGRIIYATGEPTVTTLSAEIAAGNFISWEVGEPVVCNVARALLEFHRLDQVHGRVRPYHIVKTGDGWRLSGHVESKVEERLERLTRVREEPVYLPPENYRQGLYGVTVDAWALGVCLHQASCGRIPYPETGDILEEVVKNPPRVERPSGRFGSVVRGLLGADPEERWDLQRAIDHIERPRGGEFQSGGPGANTPKPEPEGDPEKTEEAHLVAPTGPVVERPLFARMGFLFACLLCFIGTAYLGYTQARLPKIPRLNPPKEPLYSVDFSHSRVDPDGRIITNKPEQAVAYAESLKGGVRLEMVQVPPGAFMMGSTVDEPYGDKSERPKHQVQVGGFYISRFEVTQQQWQAVANLPAVAVELPQSPSQFRGLDRPVEGVTWTQAKEFCNRLSRATGRYYRLPTEAEWEFACRAGTKSPFCFGQTINSALANYQATKPYAQEGVGEYRRQTEAVGSLGTANYFGLMDMHGNVAEWCEDHYGDYSADFQTDPVGPDSGHDRVVRGGGWRSMPWQTRSAARVGVQEAIHRNDIGFRVVLPRVVMVDPPGQ